MSQVRVVGPVAVLESEAGGDAYLYRGAVVDVEGFKADSVAHALAVGLVAKVQSASRRSAAEKAAAEKKAADEAAAAEKAAAEKSAK